MVCISIKAIVLGVFGLMYENPLEVATIVIGLSLVMFRNVIFARPRNKR